MPRPTLLISAISGCFPGSTRAVSALLALKNSRGYKVPAASITSWVAVVCLIVWQFGCGGGPKSESSGTSSANISISPGSALVGSPDLTLIIVGSTKFTFHHGAWLSGVLWSQGSVDTPLPTTFVNSSQLTAILPAALLANVGTGHVRVVTWDHIEGTLVNESSSVPFEVTSTPPTPNPSISSISPSTVSAGSPGVTITIDGANFARFGHFASTAFWTTNGNLHDTGTWLQTTIVSSTQLTAIIPAALLQNPTSVQIVVMNGDVMGMSDGYFGYPRSNAVTFTVGQ